MAAGGEMTISPNVPLSHLRPVQREFVSLLDSLRFGRIENLKVLAGEPILRPRPTVIRTVKFNEQVAEMDEVDRRDYTLKSELIKFLAYIEQLDCAVIRRIEVRHGLPILIEVEQSPEFDGDERDGGGTHE
jgi:hypothetical protein